MKAADRSVTLSPCHLVTLSCFPCPLLGELSNFRGPGYYFSLVKLLITIGLYLTWVSTASWVNRDTEKSRMDGEKWNPVLLGSGLLGLLLLWVLPGFVFGFVAFGVCLGAGALSY